MLTLDTSALYAMLRRSDRHHHAMLRSRDADAGPYYIPAGIMAEVAYMVESNLSLGSLEALLLDLESGTYNLDCGERDFPRIRELVRRYADLRLGFADAAVVACAERHRGVVLTADRRHFDLVAGGEGIVVAPAVH